MRDHDRPRPHTNPFSQAFRRGLRTEQTSSRQPRSELITDAVVASYIHTISDRHQRRSHRRAWPPSVDA